MVVGAFPAVKLAVLLFKQISKPIANLAKERAKNNKFFRTYVCMPPAHFYNWCEVKAKMWVMNLGKPVTIPTLNEQMAIELGANLLGEGLIFILGAGVVIVEYSRSSKKEAQKEEKQQQELEYMNTTIRELYFTVQKQDTEIRQLQRTIYDLEDRVVVKPWVQKKDAKDPTDGPPPEARSTTPVNVTNDDEFEVHADKKHNMKIQRASLPYPDSGIIMKSLNYLELVVLNTPQVEDDDKLEEAYTQKKSHSFNRRPSLLNEALNYLEYDLKGIL